MKVRKNVYIVYTEYQLLQAINIAVSVYGAQDYSNTVYIVRNGRRMKGMREDHSVLGNMSLQFVDKKTPKFVAHAILQEKPDHFLFFQGNSGLNVYLGHKLSRLGAEISLGPDGYSAYVVFNRRFPLLSKIKDTYTQNRILFSNRLLSSRIHVFDNTYARHNCIDNIWLTHPDQYTHRGRNNVNIMKLPEFGRESLQFITELFNFTADFPTKDAIFFFNQPLPSGLLDLEYNFLTEVMKKFPTRTIMIKLHPLTTESMKIKYSALKAVEVIQSNVPAEVILGSLQNCIVYSGWSSVLITDNKSCNYYFNYPVFKKVGHKNLSQIEIPALNHIKMIESVEEMTFPDNADL